MTAQLHRRTGFEIELMAPAGLSRRTLAEDLAARSGGRVQPVWHSDSEPSLVPGLGRFLHLTQGFAVRRADGSLLCTLVDDVTLLADLDPRTAPPPGWFRILSDDSRLINLLAAQSDPGGTLDEALDATARLWGTTTERIGSVYRLNDPAGTTIALAAPQGAERERPCEIVTPPLTGDHGAALEELLGPARELGFTVPREAAVHLHLDGAPFRRPHALANVVRLFAHWREPLRTLLQTNPACRRLAPLPEPLVAAAAGNPSEDDLRKAATDGELTKFFDVNLTQLLTDTPLRDTIEIRILPGAVHADDILNRAGLLELLLDRCLDPEPFPAAPEAPDAGVPALLDVAAGVLAERSESSTAPH
ncbi:amidoligase family protein [Jidongwangia harbinensis]|uniref:amidoligase family protein n=1 Tax=Jidongwangia harbinensis TaxID=2878561 RepID=UPI001CDA396B|nr:amidoligase family protein [Jidongwangia harbinensis]MCA2218965.1 amidoligase family protein [Jidongwangia harbinensis]